MKYQPPLDGLRAVAVTSVIICHISYHTLPGGWAGVDIFFVLSGYLISKLLVEEWEQDQFINFKNFYIRRSLRLMPAFLFLIFLELCRAALNRHQRVEILESVAYSVTYLMNWNIAFHWGPQGALGHVWSLSVEEQFYLIWPVFLMLIIRRQPILWIGILISMIVFWRSYLVHTGADWVRTYDGFDTHADSLLVGCFIAILRLRA